MQNSTDHAIQNHVCWQGGIFTSGALEPLSSHTDRAANEKVQAASDPQGCQICFLTPNFTNLTFEFVDKQPMMAVQGLKSSLARKD